MTVLYGICSTEAVPLDNHYLRAGCVDIAQRPPLWLHHQHAIGEVLRLTYRGDRLFVWAETNDERAIVLKHFSIAGKPIDRKQRPDGKFDVSAFRCSEISVVRDPVNINCEILERYDQDPLHELWKSRIHQLDLFARSLDILARGLQQVFR